ncbi:MAG: GNAT family N-acetyltransferase [Leptospira sp.]|nr:GNAT family N-acetyltransferase [Leptospira sp.]
MASRTPAKNFQIQHLDTSHRNEAIELVNQFFRKVNGMQLDGLFRIRPRAAAKMVDIYFKLCGTDKVLFIGAIDDESAELNSLLIARVEHKPYLVEEKNLYIDLAVTKTGKMKLGYMHSLLEYTENWAKEHSIAAIELRAIKENQEAVEYWKNNGFTDFYIHFRKRL